jgi:hypothetical protein
MQSEQGVTMNKIDLIIDALENWQHSCLELGRCSSELGLSTEALAAARELREMKPVAWLTTEPFAQTRCSITKVTLHQQMNGTPLYALEVTK